MSFARRLVLDTGVLVSAAIRPSSVPALAFEKALLRFEVCASKRLPSWRACSVGRNSTATRTSRSAKLSSRAIVRMPICSRSP